MIWQIQACEGSTECITLRPTLYGSCRIPYRIRTGNPPRHETGFPVANRDSAGRRAWRWYVQSDVGKLRSIKNSRCRAGDRNGTGQVAAQCPYPFPDRQRNRVFIAEKPILLHFSNGLTQPMPLAGLYSSLFFQWVGTANAIGWLVQFIFHQPDPTSFFQWVGTANAIGWLVQFTFGQFKD